MTELKKFVAAGFALVTLVLPAHAADLKYDGQSADTKSLMILVTPRIESPQGGNNKTKSGYPSYGNALQACDGDVFLDEESC